MKKIFFIFLIFCLISGGFSYVLGEDEFTEFQEKVNLYVGETKIFSADAPKRVVLGKPEIADVQTVKKDGIILLAKSPGTTTFIFWDKWGEQAFRINVFAENLSSYQDRIKDFIKELNLNKVYSKAVESEGKIMLLGEVRSQDDKERLFSALGSLKDKVIDLIKVREEKLVEIDVQVLELTKEASEALGFIWPSSVTIEDSPATGKWKDMIKVTSFSRGKFTWTLDLLESERKLHILSRPRLVCLSGKEAELLVGGEIPVFTSTVSTYGTTGNVEYKEYGIKLKIRPLVTDNNKIQLSLNTEVSEVGNVETTGYARAYPLTKRSASTELYLDDGQTIAIGGLIKQKKEVNIQKFPWLADIPILGIFFQHKSMESPPKQDTELFITLTPTIIGGKQEVSAIEKEEKTETKKTLTEVMPIQESKSLPAPLRDYISGVQNKISKFVQYPSSAKGTGWFGTVKLGLLIGSDGKLKEANIVSSSGYKLLDDSAKEAVRKASPFPPFYSDIKLKELYVEIPIEYNHD